MYGVLSVCILNGPFTYITSDNEVLKIGKNLTKKKLKRSSLRILNKWKMADAK